MKIKGGYLPKLAGCPAVSLEEIACPEQLSIDLLQQNITYTPVVDSGSTVAAGQKLAEAEIDGGKIGLPSPAAGIVTIEEGESKEPTRISIKTDSKGKVLNLDKLDSSSAAADTIQKSLVEGGIWQSIWSSKTEGAPTLNTPALPQAIVITLALTEPFRPSSDAVWAVWQSRIEAGLKFLPRLLADKGKVEFVYADAKSDAVLGLKEKVGSDDTSRFHQVPLRYPVENPLVVSKALRRQEAAISKEATIWVIDLQTVAAIGACLGEGLTLSQRILASGGPASASPKHFLATVGTPISALVPNGSDENITVLRGGVFQGLPIDPKVDTVGYGDDALFCLKTKGRPELIAFINPGFNRRSIYPAFITTLTGAADSHLSATIRGEHRPCIACSACETVCPADILPQAIHRFLFSESFDDAEELGLNRCVDCGLCTYVCPSKLDLSTEFAEAKTLIRLEKEESAKLAAQTDSDASGDEK
jgi:Na+-transporting NADH:ubiquinone oxidoreductase subunit A